MANIIQSFNKIHDKRNNRGKRYKLNSILGLVAIGFMSGCTSFRAIWKLGLNLNRTNRKKLGFKNCVMPSHPTIINILKGINPEELEGALSAMVCFLSKNKFKHIAIDGKSIRSTSGSKDGLLHLVSAFASEISATIAQVKSGRGGGEIEAAKKIIDGLELKEKVITGDALFVCSKLCSRIVSKSGDYLFKVKQNRKRILSDIIQRIQYHRNKDLPIKSFESEVNKAHGRIESRSIEVVEVGGENFGGMTTIKQAAVITRKYCNIKDMQNKEETTYIITSIAGDKASPKELLELNLKHWQIENKSHRTRDVHFKEDTSNIICHKLHQINAAMRNMAIFLLSKIDSSIREAIDKCIQQTSRAISMLFLRI